ncbi:MAG: DUF1778 domain-containing protein [Limnoraphis sp. WC205]|jgi:uncharacterized protein (DUF1778 family)|nr:DUF1778 domain-containing protein [Limnoraphis sp. WC205]
MSPSEFETQAGQTRDVTINIRAKQNQRDLIDHAAQIKGKSRSEFMLEAAYEKAQNILLDKCFFGLNEVRFQEFLDRLDAPPTPNHQLQQLLTTQSLWD